MTLHWWMHWFWVTALCTLLSAQRGDTRTIPIESPAESSEPSSDAEDMRPEAARQAKAIYIQSKPPPILSTSTTPIIKYDSVEFKPTRAVNTTEITESSIAPNATQPVTDATNARPRDNLTKQETEAPTTSEAEVAVTEQAWAIDTTLAENSPVVGDLVEASEPAGQTEDDARVRAGAVAGISLGAVALATLGGTVAFLLYRRRYLNKPQTLNDKCSNPDSSGYLDDSTVRNSEEMYSLDNDSFLNSLEAMTIQNYWTESVKHSKL